jgi:hypothetical protein
MSDIEDAGRDTAGHGRDLVEGRVRLTRVRAAGGLPPAVHAGGTAPAAVLAAIPYYLGFHPAQGSIVAIGASGGTGDVVAAHCALRAARRRQP